MIYTQNQEQKYIENYFGNFKGNLLSIGENNGKTFSNSLKLIELGWKATLIEPSPKSFSALKELHRGNNRIRCLNVAIGSKKSAMAFYESEHHLKDMSDFALLSSLDYKETERWRKVGVKFNEIIVNVVPYSEVKDDYDFITIDAEGYDLLILKQIDLSMTKLLCIEWNSIADIKKQILEYCLIFGLNNLIYVCGENLLIGR